MNEIHICVYHRNCLDGFGAATALYFYFEQYQDVLVEFYPLDYSERENFLATIDLRGKHVHVLDFSFNKLQTEFIKDTAASFVWLDHHKTAFEEHEIEFKDYIEIGDTKAIYLSPNEKSGAYLAWEFYIESIPILIKHIDDRDRWQFKLLYTKEICTALSMLPPVFEVWYNHLTDVSTLKNNGIILQEYYNVQLSRAVSATKTEITIAGHKGLCCNLPPMFASEAGNLLAAESGTFGATWFEDSEGNFKYSLRSIGDFDVSAIARNFGGGGHKNAAGFIILNKL